MTRRPSRTALTIVAIVVVLAGAIFFAGYQLLKKTEPFAFGEGCTIDVPGGTLDLDLEQSQIASTIAAVAARRKLPKRALEIAYITAIQESKLTNISFGDRDSVGIFQQRPSQGWGTVKQIMDPVYSTRRFFAALEKVDGYLDMSLHDAAQAVQRSADGGAYADHRRDAEILATAFRGDQPRAVHCWYPPKETPPPPQQAAAAKEFTRARGASREDWLKATWFVTHAPVYGLREVVLDGYVWAAATGHDGWKTVEQG
ncbi:hypothetical protein [Herbidospora cretacea]|uniref:hypothetical protein n=1 Tax=Herbidospora cretacea TaxID=28444 RepID=UPI000AA0A3E5|nr:hypothetical protein [Herbidospora cretacea]